MTLSAHIPARYEIKYVLALEQADRFIKQIQAELLPDPHGQDAVYRVNSLYFDCSDLSAYHEKLDGVDPRHKVRVRYYGEPEGMEALKASRAWFEIKHRRDARIHKDRVPVSGEMLIEWANAGRLEPRLSEKDLDASSEAIGLVEHWATDRTRKGLCHVSYSRQARIGLADKSLRVTVDTDLRASGSRAFIDGAAGQRFLPSELCVLELKFDNSMPLWLLEAVREAGLTARRYSKYCSGLEALLPEAAWRTVRHQSLDALHDPK